MLREELEKRELESLALFALKSGQSRGRRYPEPKHPYRTEFQRDRDRIVHSTAFRRLQYKTQVFLNDEGDHYRTRLTHTMEVAIIARSIARALRLNEDITEAMALAHDLGHTPFGHAGEDELNKLLENKGGFEHNRQCIRVVDILEKRYPEFPGLNLTYELREGILKHHSDKKHPDIPLDLQTAAGPSIECQVVNIADEIAYNCHDIDDGLASDILSEKQLYQISVCRRQLEAIQKEFPNSDSHMKRHIMVRRLINEFVSDLVNQTFEIINAESSSDYDPAGGVDPVLLAFSDSVQNENRDLKQFLFTNLYRHPKMVRAADQARQIISGLYHEFRSNPEKMPFSFRERLGVEPDHLVAADYIAGMTDRFAIAEYEKNNKG